MKRTRLSWLNLFFHLTCFRVCRLVYKETGEQYAWVIMGPVLPFTGWNGRPYIGIVKSYYLFLCRR